MEIALFSSFYFDMILEVQKANAIAKYFFFFFYVAPRFPKIAPVRFACYVNLTYAAISKWLFLNGSVS